MRFGAKKMTLSRCGGCRIICEGVEKVGMFEIEYY
jgi:hypothetical protein